MVTFHSNRHVMHAELVPSDPGAAAARASAQAQQRMSPSNVEVELARASTGTSLSPGTRTKPSTAHPATPPVQASTDVSGHQHPAGAIISGGTTTAGQARASAAAGTQARSGTEGSRQQLSGSGRQAAAAAAAVSVLQPSSVALLQKLCRLLRNYSYRLEAMVDLCDAECKGWLTEEQMVGHVMWVFRIRLGVAGVKLVVPSKRTIYSQPAVLS